MTDATGDDTAVDADAIPRDRPIVLFDGVCNLCNGGVQWLIDHDPDGQFRFAPLQSGAAQALLADVGFEDYDFDTFVLVDGDDYYTKSGAALEIARRLDRPWSLLALGRAVPRPLRDAVYDLVATYRYVVFGKRSQCMRPTPEIRDRFVAGDPRPDEGD